MESELQAGIDQTAALVQSLREEYEGNLSDEMGKLHNQFVTFIATAQVPLPHVLMVLEMLKAEVISQAQAEYLKE